MKKNLLHRLISGALAFSMIAQMLPGMGLGAYAEETELQPEIIQEYEQPAAEETVLPEESVSVIYEPEEELAPVEAESAQPEELPAEAEEPETEEIRAGEESALPQHNPDMTSDFARLFIQISGWWNDSRSDTRASGDFSDLTASAEMPVSAGFDLAVTMLNAVPGDYFELLLPDALQNLSVSESFEQEGIVCTFYPSGKETGGMVLSVVTLAEGNQTFTIPLQFSLIPGADIELTLRPDTAPVIIVCPSLPEAEPQPEEEHPAAEESPAAEEAPESENQPAAEDSIATESVPSEEPESNVQEPAREPVQEIISIPEAEPAAQQPEEELPELPAVMEIKEASPGIVSVNIAVTTGEGAQQIDWSPLISDEQTQVASAITVHKSDNSDVSALLQTEDSTAPYYLQYTASGFTVTNCEPDMESITLSIGTGALYERALTIQASAFDSSESINLPLKTQTVSVKPTVNNNENHTFNYQLTFTGENSAAPVTVELTGVPTNSVQSIAVPVGLSYSVTQAVNPQYQLESYKVTATGEQAAVITPPAEGTIESGKDILVETNNYYKKNVKLEISEIIFEDTLDEIDWSPIIRPEEFSFPIKLEALYSDGTTMQFNTQNSKYSGENSEFYVAFVYDGQGGGNFQILNVPNYHPTDPSLVVTAYAVMLDTSSCPSYEANPVTIPEKDFDTSATTMTVSLQNTKTMTLAPTVGANSEDASFKFNASFHQPGAENPALKTEFSIDSGTQKSIHVPIGVDYDITQSETAGYKLESYQVTESEESEPAIIKPTDNPNHPCGNVSDKNITVTTVNYAQNLRKSFIVNWEDNMSRTRPAVNADNFILKYKVTNASGETEWVEATAENLGVTPVFDASRAEQGEYAFTGLPGVDADGNPLEYEVFVRQPPENYNYSEAQSQDPANPTVFTFTEKMNFTSTIIWRDSSNAYHTRPSGVTLKFYRHVEGGDYEEITLPEGSIESLGNNWDILVKDLPRYNSQNQEYGYAVQIVPVNNYITYYGNVGGNANDGAYAHNNGWIIEKSNDKTTFEVQKIWNDDLQKADRPKANVTLWRYSIPEDADKDPGIDEMFAKNKAARVVYRKAVFDAETGEIQYQDIVLSYDLSGEDTQKVVFDHTTISDLPESFKLPQYDENGLQYVYFVRETVEGENYATSYRHGETEYVSGAPDGGTINNTRREKAAITVSKVWKSPANLDNLNGASVTMTIVVNGEELTVYSEESGSYAVLTGADRETATTVTGFSENSSVLDGTFYVNICDAHGKHYDMTKAQIKEIKVTKTVDGTPQVYNVYTEDGVDKVTIETSGDVYKIDSEYRSQKEHSDGMKEFSYQLSNTITAKREYELIKKWGSGIDYSDIKAINFDLYRRSSKDGAEFEPVSPPEGEGFWQITDTAAWDDTLTGLEKYDSDGYAYFYKAEEVSFIMTDDSVKTVTEMRADTTRGWHQYYTRSEDSTRVLNYIPTEDVSTMRFVKEWFDNGDTASHGYIRIRIYHKSDILTALSEMADTDRVSLSALSIGYGTVTLNAQNNWDQDFGLAAIEKAITRNENAAALTPEEYLALEYAVSNTSAGPEGPAAEYSVADLRAAAQSSETYAPYSLSGVLHSETRQYRTDAVQDANNPRLVRFTNTRIGQAGIALTKEWKDADASARPETIRFRIYQDDTAFNPVSVTENGVTTEITEPILFKDASDTVIAELAVNGILTLHCKTGSLQSVSITDLPLFSNLGAQHIYSAEEMDNIQGYESKGGLTGASADPVIPDKLTYSYSFTNTRVGKTGHVAYKIWHDAATAGADRPDLFFTLYQCLESEQADPAKWHEYVTTKDPTLSVLPSGSVYNWKIELNDLPAFDTAGQPYVYEFRETMSSATNAFGTYVHTTERVQVEGGNDYFDVHTNTITGTMTIEGEKVWLMMDGYYLTSEDLPSPTIELYRTQDSTLTLLEKSAAEITALIDNNTITLVSRETLDRDKYHYGLPSVDKMSADEKSAAVAAGLLVLENNEYVLPQFAPDGSRYYYLLWEKLDSGIADELYTRKSAGGTLQNIFRRDINRRKIQVTKFWDRPADLTTSDNRYPSVTYYLYRYEEGNISNAKRIKTHTISAAEITAAEEAGTHASYIFDDLLIYSPNGKRYGYYVKEKAISGYTISYADETAPHTVSDNCPQCIPPETYSDAVLEGGSDYSDASYIEHPFNSGEHISQVSTCNTYNEPGRISMHGQKYWNDYNNSPLISGIRPEYIDVVLERRTNNESAQSNKVPKETIALVTETAQRPAESTDKSPYIVWKKDNTGYWEYTIYNLKKIAPNGMPYIYTLTENAPQGYKAANPTIAKSLNGDESESEPVQMSDLKNNLTGKYTVRKNWIDSDNRYGLRPESITVVLQRSRDGGTTWETIPWVDGYATLPTAVKINGEDVVSYKLTAENLIPKTKGNSWEYTFTNLPEYFVQGTEYVSWKYRCVEYKMGNVLLMDDSGDTGLDKYVPGAIWKTEAYLCETATPDSTRTVLKNNLQSTKLYVEKHWHDDEDNLYLSRPEKLEFVLQVRTIDENSPAGLKNWHAVKKDGADYTFEITAASGWATELHDLPVAIVGGTNNEAYYAVQFRAVEKSLAGNVVEGALNYVDETSYVQESNNHQYNPEQLRNETTIENKLIPNEVQSISVTKVWQRYPGESVSTTFELLYRRADESPEKWHCIGDLLTCGSGTASGCRTEHSESAHCVLKTLTRTDAGSETFTWNNLPKCDIEGHDLVFKVIEYPIEGYSTTVKEITADGKPFPGTYTFTNIELQSYTVKKTWQNASYAQKSGSGFTAEFQLQQKIEGESEWTDVEGKTTVLTSSTANDSSKSFTWTKLPKYTLDGKKIEYRAAETKINGIAVADNTAYIVTYAYDEDANGFSKTTTATNRMVYGYVNLSKQGAYIDGGTLTANSKLLKDVSFNIYTDPACSKLYVKNVKTDASGNLVHNAGKYGDEQKYLITGTYYLKEITSAAEYTLWKEPIAFTVGLADDTTGEHGTAWISALPDESQVTYLPKAGVHTFVDTCAPQTSDRAAYNVESRGVVSFTKTGSQTGDPQPHAPAAGEKAAYFGIYLVGTTTQVAGMTSDSTGRKMVLTSNDRDGAPLTIPSNSAGIPYLRTESDGQLTLLTGKYDVKELVPPPGYILDSTTRSLVIPGLDAMPFNADLSQLYQNNKGKIEASVDYSWKNTPNKVTLHKLDQFGRKVTLKENGYLILQTAETSDCFLTGENTIRLYQSASRPAAKSDGSAFAENAAPDITYNADTHVWIITGLFDAGKEYILSEDAAGVPDANIIAAPIHFTVDTSGKMQALNGTAVEKDTPTYAVGNDYANYYHASSANNAVVLRDIARYHDAVLLKYEVDAQNTEKPIQYISFKLEKQKADGTWTSVLAPGKVLTTNAEGKIVISETSRVLVNLITGRELRYGLDVGTYRFVEVEAGASDAYLLTDPVVFKVEPAEGSATDTTYASYAATKFTPTEAVTDRNDGLTGKVQNIPAETQRRLTITKTDGTNPLPNARFELTYTSITAGQAGAHTYGPIQCVTDAEGKLYQANESWQVLKDSENHSVPVYISRKGTYTLKEILAPEKYMTPTDANGNPVVMLTFRVDSQNRITCTQRSETYISAAPTITKSGDIHISLNADVRNDPTVVYINKLNDIVNQIKTSDQKNLNGEQFTGAVLRIYEGESAAGTPVCEPWNSSNTPNIIKRVLKENQVYTLHEESAPVGYLKAEDIQFKLWGTTTRGDETVSQLYVKTNGSWSKVTNIKDNTLTMVDEVIIAPVDLLKKVGTATLPGAEFSVTSLDDNTVLGTALTASDGHLVWKSLTAPADLVYDSAGKRISTAAADSMQQQKIVLRQNTNGYAFTETYAPDNAYNTGGTYTVTITAANYLDYRTGPGTYASGKYVDIITAAANSGMADLNNTNNPLVNPPFEASFELYKYDAEHPAANANHNNYSVIGLSGVEFELQRTKDARGNDVSEAPVTVTTGENGLLHINLTRKGTYTLKETKPLTGYIGSSDSLVFTIVNSDYQKTLTYDAAEENHTHAVKNSDGTATGTAWADVPNTRKHGAVTFTKFDIGSGEKLNGVQFTLRRVAPEDGKLYPASEDTQTFVTGRVYTLAGDGSNITQIASDEQGSDGVLVIKNLQWGKYELTETMELPGYLKSDAVISFTIDHSNVHTPMTAIDLSPRNNTRNQVVFSKVSNDSSPLNLPGAVFEVHSGSTCDESCTAVAFYASRTATEKVTRVISGEGGTVAVYGLPTNTAQPSQASEYHLAEITAPLGYELASAVPFTINRAGVVTFNNTTPNDFKVTMVDIPIVITLVKVGEIDTLKLSGAKFKLTDICETCTNAHKLADGNTVKSDIVTDENGTAILKAICIADHTYQLTETQAPAGYEATAVIKFTVKPDGTVENLTPSGGYATESQSCAFLNDEKDSITIRNEKIRTKFIKQDADGETPLAGIVFKLVPYGTVEGSQDPSKFASADTELILTTDADGKLTIPVGKLIHSHSYELIETSLGDHLSYRLAEEQSDRHILFRVEKDGTLKVLAGSSPIFGLTENTAASDSLVLKNEKIELVILKVDEATGAALQGVTFELTTPENTTVTLVTDAEGKITLQTNNTITIRPGAYTLRETDSPDTHNRLKIALKFTIDAYGMMVLTDTGRPETSQTDTTEMHHYSAENPQPGKAGPIVLKVTNPRNSILSLTKQDAANPGSKLSGVKFTVEYSETESGTFRYVVNSGNALAFTDHVPSAGSAAQSVWTTGADGVLQIANMPDGFYRLTEIETAAGYNLLSGPLYVKIDRVTGEAKLRSSSGSWSDIYNTLSADTLSITVNNRKGVVLPATGSRTPVLPAWILMLTALIESAALYLYSRQSARKRRKV